MTSPLNLGAPGRVLYYDIGRSASVVVLTQDGGLALRTNGLPEALMDTPGSVPRFSGEYWLSPLAVIARPEARDMLMVGFGGGMVIEGAPPSVQRIDVIELEPKVIEANRHIAPLRRRDPVNDPRVNVILNDARGALRLTDRRYDAIVSQPSHPWTAGASHLYTREFMQLAHEHLNPGGVFVQWMNVMFMDEDLLRSLTATLLSVFPELRVYRPDPSTLVFLASDQPLNLETQLAATGMPLRGAPMHYARFGINNIEDVVTALVLDTAGAKALSAHARLITDDDNRIATSSVFEKGRGMNGESSGRALAAHDPWQRPDSLVYGSLREQLSFPYMIRRNGVFLLIDRQSHRPAAQHGADPRRIRRWRIRARVLLPHDAPGATLHGTAAPGDRPVSGLRAAARGIPARLLWRTGARAGIAAGGRSREGPARHVRRACSPPRAMPRSRSGAKSRSPTPISRRFRGPMPGIPRRWTCASTGARGSPARNRRDATATSRSR